MQAPTNKIPLINAKVLGQVRQRMEDATHTEQALDLVRGQVDALAGRAAAREQRWVAAGVPWDRDTVKRARFASLHLAQAFMSG